MKPRHYCTAGCIQCRSYKNGWDDGWFWGCVLAAGIAAVAMAINCLI